MPFPSIVRFDAEGKRVEEKDIAMAVIDFWGGPSVDIQIKSSYSPQPVVQFRIDDWDSEGRDDEQKLAFLGELVRRLVAASSDGKGVLLPEIKRELVRNVLASHWTREPQETTP